MAFGSSLGTGIGTGVGAYYGGTAGANIGGTIGGAIGGVGDSLFSSSGNSAKAIQDQLNLGMMTQAVNVEQAREAMKWSEGQAGETRNFNSAQAVQQMQFQERMAGTAHQREIADLKAAGLNPVLSVMGGPGSATPAGAAGSASTPGASQAHVSNPYDSYAGDVISAKKLQSVDQVRTAIDVARGIADIGKTVKETKVLDTTERLQNAQEISTTLQGAQSHTQAELNQKLSNLTEYQQKKLEAETGLTLGQIKLLTSQQGVMESQVAENMSKVNLNSALATVNKSLNDMNLYQLTTNPSADLKYWTNSAKAVGDAGGAFSGIINDLMPKLRIQNNKTWNWSEKP